jgi:hypothetical protein
MEEKQGLEELGTIGKPERLLHKEELLMAVVK